MTPPARSLEGLALIDAALAYAVHGIPVFPLKPGEKTPLIPKAEGGNGVYDATTDLLQIETWWDRWPDANIGLACGAAFWVFDVDFTGFETDERDGADTIVALYSRFGRFPVTVKQFTGGLGWQYFFEPDARIRNGVRTLPGVDTRSTGGYVVAPPSRHPSGYTYRWIVAPWEAPIAPAPAWLVALLEPVAEAQSAPRPIRAGDLSRYAAAALERACDRVERAPVGEQCDTLEHQTYGIGRLVGGGIIPHGEAKGALVGAGLRMPSASGRAKDGKPNKPWTRREIEWRVERALAAGERKPRAPEARP
jgi:hypothetical protein